MGITPWQFHEHSFTDGRLLTVALPEHYDSSTGNWPLLVCHDPQWILGTLCDVSVNLGFARQIPRVVVVGVGWNFVSMPDLLARRASAYTPTVAPYPRGVFPGAMTPPRSGGAAEHLRWMQDAALPFLQDNYRLDACNRTFVGHSFSALFGLHSLLNAPEIYARYLLASPSIWWDDRAILGIEAAHEAVAVEAGRSTRVLVTVGSLETEPGPGDGAPSMLRNVADLTAQMAGRSIASGIRLDRLELAGETHHSTVPAALSRGLRLLFAD